MARHTHDLGSWYWHVMRVPALTPPVQLQGLSHEVEDPWRIGRCVLLRLGLLPLVLVLGKWGPGRTREEMEQVELAPEAVAIDTAAIREKFRPPPVAAGLVPLWRTRRAR